MDKPRYKLLKDMPTVKAGTTFQEITRKVDGSKILKEYKSDNKVSILVSEINDFDEWFGEIQEPTDSIHWKPVMGEEYWLIYPDGDIVYGVCTGGYWDDTRYKMGSVYRTEKEAEKARDRRLAEVRLRRTSTFKPDI